MSYVKGRTMEKHGKVILSTRAASLGLAAFCLFSESMAISFQFSDSTVTGTRKACGSYASFHFHVIKLRENCAGGSETSQKGTAF
ncbi:MAG: hypothetical protein L6406_20470, partial [Desulfobacterales bacterium]|nr:hypothetical protein [Desulfobacterales bacterium]